MKTRYTLTALLIVCTLGGVISFFGRSSISKKQEALIDSKNETRQAAKVASFESSDRPVFLSKSDKSIKKEDIKDDVLNYDPTMLAANWGIMKTNSHKAWEVSQGSKEVIVAVIDTGADIYHKGLKDNLWVNTGETGKDKNGQDKATNQIDDDGNGYIDDVHGFSFVHNHGRNLEDNHGHGTHIAGIIGARGSKPGEARGVAPHVSLMILKYHDPKVPTSNNLRNTIEAIRYAVKTKERLDEEATKKGTSPVRMIINYSGGGVEYSQEEHDAVKLAGERGILVIAAAGNEHSNSDEKGKHFYPADYDLKNIISVTAVNKGDTAVLNSSNYGVRTVDLAAPGENIYNAAPDNQYTLMTGTSQATAFVSGVAALIWAHTPELTAPDVKKYIIKTGDEYTSLLSKTGSAKLLNSYKALVNMDEGLSATGVKASNTANITHRSFASSQEDRDANLNTSALSQNSAQPDASESLATFGKDFVKALESQSKHPMN